MDLEVVGMTCAHCVKAVTEAVSGVAGVSTVSVQLATGTVHVEGTPDPASIRTAIEDAGYDIR